MRTNSKPLTDDEVEAEIQRLSQSEDVKLARKYARFQYRRRQMLYSLRDLEKKGRALKASGFTLDNFNDMVEEFTEED